MYFNGLGLEYAHEGNLSYISWMENMEEFIEYNRLKAFIYVDVSQPVAADAQLIDAWKKNVAKARRILLEGVQDHFVSNLHGKETP